MSSTPQPAPPSKSPPPPPLSQRPSPLRHPTPAPSASALSKKELPSSNSGVGDRTSMPLLVHRGGLRKARPLSPAAARPAVHPPAIEAASTGTCVVGRKPVADSRVPPPSAVASAASCPRSATEPPPRSATGETPSANDSLGFRSTNRLASLPSGPGRGRDEASAGGGGESTSPRRGVIAAPHCPPPSVMASTIPPPRPSAWQRSL